MGICQSPDIAQEIMEKVLKNIKNIKVYINDISVFSKDWQSHVEVRDKVLKALENNGFSVNPLNCEWATKETNFLGH